MSDELIFVLAELKAKEGKESEIDEVISNFVDWVKTNEQGTITYSAHRSQKDPTKIIFYEAYRREDAMAGHSQSSAFKEFGRNIVQHIDPSATKIERFDLIAGIAALGEERTTDTIPAEVPPRD
jgi:quinol monooxygenase YgiN